MQYDQAVSVETLNAELAANDRITESVLSAINSILGTENEETTEVVVGNWVAGQETVTSPEGQTSDLVVISTPEGSGRLVYEELPEEVLNSKVTVWDTDRDLDLTYNTIERVIVLGNGSDSLTVNGDQNTTVVSGGGDDTIKTSGGNDHITLQDGNNSVEAGAGDDTVFAGPGNDTIDGGEGYDVVVLDRDFDEYDVSVEDGVITIVRTVDATERVELTNVEFIQIGEDRSIVVAGSTEEAETLRLYQATLGRDADLEGAKYWLNDLNEEGYSSNEIASAFLATEEGSALNDLSDEEFVATLYNNSLNRDGNDSEIAYWAGLIDDGATRADVIIAIANSDEGQDGIANVKFIDGLV